MTWKYKYLSFDQPIGSFIMTTIAASEILEISYISRRSFSQQNLKSEGGPQRIYSPKRVSEISKYAKTSDATFPTPILLALDEGKYELIDGEVIIREEKVASVVDGQHRLLGLEKSERAQDFDLPVVFLLDANEEQKALIFAIINGKQTKVSSSLIYDLFGVIEDRNPYKTCHEIARSLNEMPSSPFFRRLKMLGRKEPGSLETLSQGTFIKELIVHISNKPEDDFALARNGEPQPPRDRCVLNSYYLKDKDDIILKLLVNVFSGLADIFPDQWGDPDNSIISKTTGYTGIMKAFPHMINKGREKKDLSKNFFIEVFRQFGILLPEEKRTLTSADFPSSMQGVGSIRDTIIEALKRV